MIDLVEAEPRSVGTLIRLAQDGDREALEELRRLGESQGRSFTSSYSADLLLYRMQDRDSETNLMARACVKETLAGSIRALSDPSDGPIEWLIVQRAALCVIDAGQADFEHIRAILELDDPRDAEAFDRRRDRANRRLLATLRALSDVRRINRPVVQVNVGDGNLNILKA
jgi:hypothetical protein